MGGGEALPPNLNTAPPPPSSSYTPVGAMIERTERFEIAASMDMSTSTDADISSCPDRGQIGFTFDLQSVDSHEYCEVYADEEWEKGGDGEEREEGGDGEGREEGGDGEGREEGGDGEEREEGEMGRRVEMERRGRRGDGEERGRREEREEG